MSIPIPIPIPMPTVFMHHRALFLLAPSKNYAALGETALVPGAPIPLPVNPNFAFGSTELSQD